VTSRSTSSILSGTEVPTYYMFVHHLVLTIALPELTASRYQMSVTGGAQILHATGDVCAASSATRITAPFIFSIAIGLFVFTAAVVL
jgi:hypothetical protein